MNNNEKIFKNEELRKFIFNGKTYKENPELYKYIIDGKDCVVITYPVWNLSQKDQKAIHDNFHREFPEMRVMIIPKICDLDKINLKGLKNLRTMIDLMIKDYEKDEKSNREIQ